MSTAQTLKDYRRCKGQLTRWVKDAYRNRWTQKLGKRGYGERLRLKMQQCDKLEELANKTRVLKDCEKHLKALLDDPETMKTKYGKDGYMKFVARLRQQCPYIQTQIRKIQQQLRDVAAALAIQDKPVKVVKQPLKKVTRPTKPTEAPPKPKKPQPSKVALPSVTEPTTIVNVSACGKTTLKTLRAQAKEAGKHGYTTWTKARLCMELGIATEVDVAALKRKCDSLTQEVLAEKDATKKKALQKTLRTVKKDLKQLDEPVCKEPSFADLVMKAMLALGPNGEIVTMNALYERLSKHPKIASNTNPRGRISDAIRMSMKRVVLVDKGKYKLLKQGEAPPTKPVRQAKPTVIEKVPQRQGSYPDPGKLKFDAFRQGITTTFAEFAFEAPPTRNQCRTRQLFPFRPHQHFVSEYITPQSPYPGLLVWHDVGTGKSCTAMLTWSRHFLEQGWQLLWVTRRKLTDDPLRDMFKDICMWGLRDYLGKLPQRKRSALLSAFRDTNTNATTKYKTALTSPYAQYVRLGPGKSGIVDAQNRLLSYREFANLCRAANHPKERTGRMGKFETQMRALDPNWTPKKDFLRKTLVIIDEAHNLYARHNLPGSERLLRAKKGLRARDDIVEIEQCIRRAQGYGNNENARLLLLSATPLPKAAHVQHYFRLLNMLLPQNPFKPRILNDLLTKDNKLNARAKRDYQERTKAIVSYLVGKEPGYFAKRVWDDEEHDIRVTLSEKQYVAIQGADNGGKQGCVQKYSQEEDKVVQAEKRALCIRQRAQYAGGIVKPMFNLNTKTCGTGVLRRKRGQLTLPPEKPITTVSSRGRQRRTTRRAGMVTYSTNGGKKDEDNDDDDTTWGALESDDSETEETISDEEEIDEDDGERVSEEVLEPGEPRCFDSNAFDEEATAEWAPKIKALIDTIEALDKADLAKRKKRYKHAVFTDLRKRGIGSRLIAAAFLARGYPLVKTRKDKRHNRIVFDMPELKDVSDDAKRRVGVLSTTNMNGPQVFTEDSYYINGKLTTLARNRMAATLRETFNAKDNIYGEKIGVIVLDSGFKEGVSLKDVRYFHLLEPPLTRGELKQSIGRVVRRCGHRAKLWQRTKDWQGWQVQIFTYRAEYEGGKPVYDEIVKLHQKGRTAAMRRRARLRALLEPLAAETAVDQPLTKAMHGPQGEETEQTLAKALGIPE